MLNKSEWMEYWCYEPERECLTPGAHFRIEVNPTNLSVNISYPNFMELTEEEASSLDSEVHDVLEAVLSKRWHLVAKEGE